MRVSSERSFCSLLLIVSAVSCFFFNDTATTEIYTLSLHDALPISFADALYVRPCSSNTRRTEPVRGVPAPGLPRRSEEHTSELQSQSNLVCRLLLEKKKKKKITKTTLNHTGNTGSPRAYQMSRPAS